LISVSTKENYEIAGPLEKGDRVQLTDSKGRHNYLNAEKGERYHTHNGYIAHDDIIGQPEGSSVSTSRGVPPILPFGICSLTIRCRCPRGAAVVYPKDAAQILMEGDIFSGATVLERELVLVH